VTGVRAVVAVIVAGLAVGARGDHDRLLLRYHPAAGDLTRVETEMTHRFTGHVVSGPTTTGERRFATVAVVTDSDGVVRLRVQIDSVFLIADQTVRGMGGGATTLREDLSWDARRQRLPLSVPGPDSLQVAAIESSLFSTIFPFPDDSVAPGASWRLKLPFVLPGQGRDDGLVQATVTMKVKDVTFVAGDTIVTLGITLHGKGRRPPSAEPNRLFANAVVLKGEERFALGRGVTTDLELHGSLAMGIGLVGGIHVPPLEVEMRITRHLLVNQ
jgi:hypothetical protein